MKLLLTSGGVTNSSIRDALIRLLGKPISESRALFIPTAQWGQPACTPETVWASTADRWPDQPGLPGMGWQSVGVLELTALPSIPEDRWVPWVRDADVLLVDGGEAVYLAHWLRQSGLADLLPSLPDLVWVGVSAGSMVMTPRIGRAFVDWQPDGTDETLGVVDFSIFPHLDYPGWTQNTLEAAHRWAAQLPGPAYAIDEQTAISVRDGDVEVISEGQWEHFPR
ncbi:Type 1 glutamine amidotransferase-like domain-containing protein [Leifsonia sp. 2TAF2]|uniref:Type 1 glutamine amidotransferase-like domain-containing protein n=1 Tax=Leifsonia sp. 2TAF2 TaxID=3233009 RepID=UPI003F9CB5D0